MSDLDDNIYHTECFSKTVKALRKSISMAIEWNQATSYRAKAGATTGLVFGTILGGARTLYNVRHIEPKLSVQEITLRTARSSFLYGSTHGLVFAALGIIVYPLIHQTIDAGDALLTAFALDHTTSPHGVQLKYLRWHWYQAYKRLQDPNTTIRNALMVPEGGRSLVGFMDYLKDCVHAPRHEHRTSQLVGATLIGSATLLALNKFLARRIWTGLSIQNMSSKAYMRSLLSVGMLSVSCMTVATAFGTGRAMFPAIIAFNANDRERIQKFQKEHEGRYFEIIRTSRKE